ncbi:MAG TPA: response regulator [Vicinamibacterales bacterium]|nr:response regulator [Vicinamibacterales bacterium]
MRSQQKFLTTQEVLEYLHVNLRTIYRLIKADKIPADPRGVVPLRRPDRPSQTRGSSRPRVLILDDDASICDLVAKTLAFAEYDVDIAPDGGSALEHMRLYPYNLLIAELKLPDIDGLTVIREAKRYKADLPIIIITGFSTESSAIEAVNLGVASYLTKPFRVTQLLAAAATALGE